MRWLPYETLTITINYPPEQVKLKLTPIVEPYRFLRLSLKGHKAFHGWVDNNEFTIRPILSYRNSFAPVIIGSVKKDKIKVIMRLNYSIIFAAALLLILALNTSFWTGFLIIVSGFLATLVFFKMETSWIKDILIDTLK